jgi:hypothetical protein
MFGWGSDILYNKTFVFIAGIEGSGTTMFLEILSQPEFAAALGGLYWTPGYKRQRRYIRRATEDIWNITLSREQRTVQKRRAYIQRIGIPRNITHVIFKRSFPFGDKKHFPHLPDICDFASKVKIVVVTRPLQSCVASIMRRGFTSSIEEAAERIKQGSVHLRKGLESIGRDVYDVFSYHDFVSQPHLCLERLERFLEYPPGVLEPYVVSLVRQPTVESRRTLNEHAEFLNNFFRDFHYGPETIPQA